MLAAELLGSAGAERADVADAVAQRASQHRGRHERVMVDDDDGVAVVEAFDFGDRVLGVNHRRR